MNLASFFHPTRTTKPADSLPPETGLPFLIENEKDGSLLVLVPGGTFLAGGKGEYEGKGAPFAVELPAFYIGLTCVTNAQYEKFVRETKHRAPDKADYGEAVWNNGGYPPEKAGHPVVCVDWNDAKAYCAWAGLRLPGELECEKAARGVDGREYPWGSEWDKNKCRNNKNKGNETTADVWGYASGVGPIGCQQIAGNVFEWCGDPYQSGAYDRYKRGDLKPPRETVRRVLRGGSWQGLVPGFFLCACRISFDPAYRSDYLGFRTARNSM